MPLVPMPLWGRGPERGLGGPHKGFSSPTEGGPMDSIQTDGIETTLQGVARQTDRGILEGRSDAVTNGTSKGGGQINSSTEHGTGNGKGKGGIGEEGEVYQTRTRGDRYGTPGGPQGTQTNQGRRTDVNEGEGGATPPQLGGLVQVP